jgi:hypothetical protein
VIPDASTVPTPSPDLTGGPSPTVVVPPGAEQASPVQSQGPQPGHRDPGQPENPYVGPSDPLNDGLSEDPGQPRQPDVSQDPNSNG